MTESPPSGQPRISVRDLSFSHGVNPALRNLSLDLHPGKHYVVAGPNGAGKSTLLDILAGLRRPQAGTYRLMGRDAEEYDAINMAKTIALAPQEFSLEFSFSVREIVAMGRRPHLDRWGRMGEDDRSVVEQAIRRTHLDLLADRAVTTLSGGEKRRCIVARALAQATPVLLLDEPCSGLDVKQALAVMSLAKTLAAQGTTVVTVSHDLNLAARYGDEFIFLKNGTLAATGPVADVFSGAVLSGLYETGAHVARDDFGGGLAVSFKEK